MARTNDIILIGAGTAGLMAGIFGSRAGGHVLVLEATGQIGGTLHMSSGRMSAAGTKLQASKGIEDSVQDHYDDVMRICHNAADPAIVRLAVEHAASTFDWLTDNGLPLVPQSPTFHAGSHEPYLKKRYSWCPEYGKSIIRVLAPHFYGEIAAGGVTLKLNTTVTELIQDPKTLAVTGVRARNRDGETVEYFGRHVLIATGGYGASAKMVAELHGMPLYNVGAPLHADGSGIRLGMAAGGYVRGAEHFPINFGVVLDDYDYPSETIGRAQTSPEERQPWEIYLDTYGNRFVAEDEPSIDAREVALLDVQDQRFWIVFDQAILDQAPPVMLGWSREQVQRALGNHPMFLKADTLADLARQAGMPVANVEKTVAAYNAGLKGSDPLGRKHRPAPIAKGPFYAIRQHATIIVTSAGLAVDGELRVLDKHQKPIPNLYAAGEALGSVATMGHAHVNGMMVTPALVFGRLLGERLVQQPVRQRAAAE